MTTSVSFIQYLNKEGTNQQPFGQLPSHVQEQLQALYHAGIYLEVYGSVSKAWQPMSLSLQTGKKWFFESKKFYRLAGNLEVSMRRYPNGSRGYVKVTDVEALPETAVPFSCEGRGAICHVIPLQ